MKELKEEYGVEQGSPSPLGAEVNKEGTNFALFSRHATHMTLLLFEREQDKYPKRKIFLDPVENRTGDIWHVFVHGVEAGTLYLYQPEKKVSDKPYHLEETPLYLIGPYAKAITSHWERENTKTLSHFPKAIVTRDEFDWEGDRPLHTPLQHTVLYEMHVKGFTAHPQSKVKQKGTFQGITEKISYLKELGITAVELLPIFEFNEFENTNINPITGERLKNYWGYSTVAFFAPKAGYVFGSHKSKIIKPSRQLNAFKSMVRELHRSGIEVILDVVFNHTAEGDEHGPMYSFKGFDSDIYYIKEPKTGEFLDLTGCGNTVNCNHPVVCDFIIDCLRYWVITMHVDGFRFDLASIFARNRKGELLSNAPLIERIEEDPVLRGRKLIAEPWDAAGGYHVGNFGGAGWAEWNDHYRDEVRRFWFGEKGLAAKLATRFAGSSDLYHKGNRKPVNSINFITCHDGFTLNDVVSYKRKHNESNGEGNRDGNPHEISINWGTEGETKNKTINRIRERLMKSMFATLMLSLGTPMILSGDECKRTQKGNNNAYCQDNEISWFNWELIKKNEGFFRFCKECIRFRKEHPAFTRKKFLTGEDADKDSLADITWLTEKGTYMEWNKATYLLSVLIDGDKLEIGEDKDDNDCYLMFNASQVSRTFTIHPSIHHKNWYLAMDTALGPPYDIYTSGNEPYLKNQNTYLVKRKTLVVLLAK